MNEKQQSTLRKIARRDILVPKEWLRIVGKPENETREDFVFAPVPTVLKLVELGYLERRSEVPYLCVKVTPDGANWIWQNAPHIFADAINGSATLSTDLTDAEATANTVQHARSIPHAIADTIDAYMVAVDPSEVDELIQLQADKEMIALEIQEAEETLVKPVLKPRTPHDLAMGVWHDMAVSADIFYTTMELRKFCKKHGIDYEPTRNELVYQVSKDNPKGYTRHWQNLTGFESIQLERAVSQFIAGYKG